MIIGLVLLSFVLVEYNGFIEINCIERLARLFFKTMHFICFIGFGSIVSYFYQGKMDKKMAIICSMGLVILYLGYFVYIGKYATQWKTILSYGSAYVLFVTCYVLRSKFSKQGMMGYLGHISYSLYLVHGVPGFIMMYWMIDHGIEPLLAISTAIFCLLLIANMFYWLVENKAIRGYKYEL